MTQIAEYLLDIEAYRQGVSGVKAWDGARLSSPWYHSRLMGENGW